MSGYPFAVALSLGLVVFLVVLLRTRRLREKYAITWIVVALGVCVFGAFPVMAEWLARAVGVQTPSNLLFAIALIVLLLVCIQLSTEITSLEEETRTLVEEVALLRFDVGRALAAPEPLEAAPLGPAPVGPALAEPVTPVLPTPASGLEAAPVEADRA